MRKATGYLTMSFYNDIKDPPKSIQRFEEAEKR